MAYEILEHTADVGVGATGRTLEELFYEAARGLAAISDTWHPGEGRPRRVLVEADDLEGLLVDWLGELLYLQDANDAVIAGLEVASVNETRAEGSVALSPRAKRDLEGTAVKAITYHQLRVSRTDTGWRAQLFVDV